MRCFQPFNIGKHAAYAKNGCKSTQIVCNYQIFSEINMIFTKIPITNQEETLTLKVYRK